MRPETHSEMLILHPLVERLDQLVSHLGLLGHVVDQLLGVEPKTELLGDHPSHLGAARAILPGQADHRLLDALAFDPLALCNLPLFLPEQNLPVHEMIDVSDHRTSSASHPRRRSLKLS